MFSSRSLADDDWLFCNLWKSKITELFNRKWTLIMIKKLGNIQCKIKNSSRNTQNIPPLKPELTHILETLRVKLFSLKSILSDPAQKVFWHSQPYRVKLLTRMHIGFRHFQEHKTRHDVQNTLNFKLHHGEEMMS